MRGLHQFALHKWTLSNYKHKIHQTYYNILKSSYNFFAALLHFLSSLLLQLRESCELQKENRHKLLTFPLPRNSRAILGERGRKEGSRKRESIWLWCVSYGSRSSWGGGRAEFLALKHESRILGH